MALTNDFKIKNGLTVIDSISAGGNLSASEGFFDSDVGIGTNNPSAALTVEGSANDSTFRLDSASGSGYIDALMGNTPYFRLYQSNGNRLQIGPGDGNINRFTNTSTALDLSFATNGGNVGIGTTAPGQKLTIAGNLSAHGSLSASGAGYNYFKSRVGIGTTSPSAKLEVSSDDSQNTIRLENTDTSIDTAQEPNAIEFYTNDASTSGTGVTGKISQVAENPGNLYGIAFNTYSLGLSESMRIDSEGNVGIGTTAPGQKLTIAGNLSAHGSLSASGAGYNYFNSRVGIGTTAPDYRLDIGGSGSSTSNTLRMVQGNGGAAIRVGAGGLSNDVTLLRVDGGSNGSSGASDSAAFGFSLKYMGSRSGNLNSLSLFSDNQALSSQVEAVTILQDGKVGIGTASSDFTLEVVADESVGVMAVRNAANARDTFRSENAAGTRTFNIGNDSNGHGLVLVREAGGTITSQIAGNGDTYFDTDTLYIDHSTDRVGIGTTSPNQKLTVGGSLDTETAMGVAGQWPSSQIRLESTDSIDNTGWQGISFDASSTDQYGWSIGVNRSSGGYSSFRFYEHFNSATGTERFTLLSGGNVGIGTASPREKFHVSCGVSGFSGTYNVRTQAIIESDNSAGTALAIMGKNTGNSSIWFGDQDSETIGQIYYNHPSNYLALGASGATQAVVNSTGLGIGTTAPGQKLTVAGNLSAHGSLSASGAGYNYFNSRVGIGTTSPSTPLEVAGKGRFSDTDNTANVIEAYRGGSSNSNIKITNSDGYWVVGKASGGFFGISPDNLNTNAGSVFAIKTDGNVGIGTTSPSAKLHVNHASDAGTYARFSRGTTNIDFDLGAEYAEIISTIKEFRVGTSDAKSFHLVSNDSNRITINSSGYVGIGTASPSTKLQVTGDSLVTGNSTIYGNLSVTGDFTCIETTVSTTSALSVTNTGTGPALFVCQSGVQPVAHFIDANGGDVVIADDGKVGIGTFSPSRQLEVSDSGATVAAKVTATDGSQSSLDLANTEGSFRLINDGGTFSIYDDGDSEERLRINTTGNVGIGTNSPSQLLHLCSSTSNPTGIGVQNSQRYYSVRSNNFSLVFTDETVGSERMRIDSSGNLGIGTTAPGQKLTVAGSLSAHRFCASDSLGNQKWGESALNANTTGCHNTAIGTNALYGNTTGFRNTAIGTNALEGNTVGQRNAAIGHSAMRCALSGSHNFAAGTCALYSNYGGDYNTAIGLVALCANTEGSSNIALGCRSLEQNTTGNHNVAIGNATLRCNTDGSSNVAFGSCTIFCNTTGNHNVAIGSSALKLNETGTSNAAFGVNALRENTVGGCNFAAGTNSMKGSLSGCRNIAIGPLSLCSNYGGCDNVSFGYGSLCNNTTGDDNVAIGCTAMRDNTIGSDNVAIGCTALLKNTTGCNNVAIGNDSMVDNTTGFSNTAVGLRALLNNVTGCYNVALGMASLQNAASGTDNVAVGRCAAAGNYGGSNNIAIGLNAMCNSGAASSNTVIGVNAQFSKVTGDHNTALGQDAGRCAASGSITSSNNSVFLGYLSRGAAASSTNEIVLGANTQGCGDNTTMIGNSSTTATYICGNVCTSGSLSASGAGYNYFNSRVGIGTTSPSESLEVVGTARMDNGITEGTHYVGDGVQHWGDGGTGLLFPSNDVIDLETASTSRIPSIDSSGNVGIGTTAPGQKLTIAGNLSAHGSLSASGAGYNYFNSRVGIGTTSPTEKLPICKHKIQLVPSGSQGFKRSRGNSSLFPAYSLRNSTADPIHYDGSAKGLNIGVHDPFNSTQSDNTNWS
jgi:hypothetical protein